MAQTTINPSSDTQIEGVHITELAAKEILRMRDLLEQILADHTGQPIERIHTDTDRDFVMEANEALEYGVIDSVITSRDAIDRSAAIR